MDDCAFPSLNPRKRKADPDDSEHTTDVSSSPRQSSWLPPNTAAWVSPSVPDTVLRRCAQKPPKRLRIDTQFPPRPLRRPSRMTSPTSRLSPYLQSPIRRSRKPTDQAAPLPVASSSRTSPLTPSFNIAVSPSSTFHRCLAVLPPIPIDPNSPHIPSVLPLVNRQTLKELDLDAILRNPQLRHDLLFDSGLQFRPTSSRRKRQLSDNYWAAVQRELESGCTCISFDEEGNPHDLVCACNQVPLPSSRPMIAFSYTLRVMTLRMPSRLRPLLTEFLQVLLSVIQPLSCISGMYTNLSLFASQMQQHAAQAAHLRSVFDPDLIQQETAHGLFDPSGLFRAIGTILKSHCAPMRDRAVETMMEVAQKCAPGGGGTKADAVKAFQMCLEVLELMKLDIANHQLQTLRPFLVRTASQFELKAFRGRKDRLSSLLITRQWLQEAHQHLLTSGRPLVFLHSPASVEYRSLTRNQQIHLSVIRGLIDLVFIPSSHTPDSSSPSSPSSPFPPSSPITPTSPTSPTSLSGFPETTYLDSARLSALARDSADTVALYMYLMLYRQLVFSARSGNTSQDSSKVETHELLQLKKEIRAISCASGHIGLCFIPRQDVTTTAKGAEEQDKWRSVRDDVVLQVTTRAKDTATVSGRDPADGPVSAVPDGRLLNLAERWSESNMHLGSPLSVLLRNRLRDTVFSNVVAAVHQHEQGSGLDFGAMSSLTTPEGEVPAGLATGMEPLADEIRSLSERLSRLALIHLNVYLPLYEHEDFLEAT